MTEISRIGFTTTIPVEVLFAGGHTPVDLNNLFIASPRPAEYVRLAESDGFPRNSCGWIKGIYGVVRRHGITDVIGVAQGDCSFTQALMEVLQYRGVSITPFSFPYDRDHRTISLEIRKLALRFGTTVARAGTWKRKLDAVRRTANEIDRLTWEEGKVTGEENHSWLVSCSDFEGDPEGYERKALAFLAGARKRAPRRDLIPLAFVGVPPITSGLHAFFEEARGRLPSSTGNTPTPIPSSSVWPTSARKRYGGAYGGSSTTSSRSASARSRTFCCGKRSAFPSLRWKETSRAPWTDGRRSGSRPSLKCFAKSTHRPTRPSGARQCPGTLRRCGGFPWSGLWSESGGAPRCGGGDPGHLHACALPHCAPLLRLLRR